ncbi:MAG: hypothetical protein ABSG67_17980, partial [Thermoguttaceae bacterium]
MLIFENRKFIQSQFDSEDELEKVVINNSEYFFGPSSVYFPQTWIKTIDGYGTKPDGIAFDISARKWYIVEAELGKHNVWNHIAPQVSKQIVASTNIASRQILIDLVIEKIKEDKSIQDKFDDEGIEQIDIRSVLGEIIEKDPIIGMPIDSVSNDLRNWASTLKYNVKLWIVRKHVEFGNSQVIMYEFPEEFKPVLDTEEESADDELGMTRYDVTIDDLMAVGLLNSGDKLSMSYKPRNTSEKKIYEAIILEDGKMDVLGNTFDTPSYAALYCIQKAGSNRNTVNGWISWKNSQNVLL